jgi:hypothetical protein
MSSAPLLPPNGHSTTLSENTILVVIEGPGDRTRRPRRPNIPYMPPPKDTDPKENGGDNPPAA